MHCFALFFAIGYAVNFLILALQSMNFKRLLSLIGTETSVPMCLLIGQKLQPYRAFRASHLLRVSADLSH